MESLESIFVCVSKKSGKSGTGHPAASEHEHMSTDDGGWMERFRRAGMMVPMDIGESASGFMSVLQLTCISRYHRGAQRSHS